MVDLRSKYEKNPKLGDAFRFLNHLN